LEPSSPNQWNVKSPNRLNSKLPSVVSKTGVFKLHDEPLTNTPGGFDDVESPRNVYLSVVKNVPENPLDDEEKISVGTEKNTLDESSQIPVSVTNLVNRSIKDLRRTAPKRLGF
jgi:hypothetical protein